MKARYFVLLSVFAVFFSEKAFAHDIPIPSGTFSTTTTGSFAICLDPTTFADADCTTQGVKVFPLTVLQVGSATLDQNGNACASVVETDSDFPVDATAPFVSTNEHIVSNVTNYDPNTGTGDDSFIGYSGGTCNGASFDNTGAMQLSSGTGHFSISEDGKRIDGIATKLITPTNSIGDFSIYTVDRKVKSRD